MKIMLLVVADYASIEPMSGKLNIMGAFDNIVSKNFPCRHPRLAVTMKIRAELEDHHEERKLKMELIDEDGHKLVHFSTPFRLPQTGTGLLGEHSAVIELNNLRFPKPGIYSIEIYADDELLGQTPLQLMKAS